MYDLTKYEYREEPVQEAIDFIQEVLVLPTSGVYTQAGQPFKLIPYQVEYLETSLGWYDIKTNQLKHIFNYLEVPKGNGKTPLMAAIAILKSCYCGIVNGEIYLLAATRDQASRMFEDCERIIRLAGLLDKFKIYQSSKKIVHKKSGTLIKALSSDASGHEGLRPDCVIMDEIHVQPNDVLYNTLAEGMDKKANAQFYMITTAGVVGTFGHNIHKYAKQIEQGIVTNDSWNVKIYAASHDLSDEECLKEENWLSANPGLGTIKSIEKLRKFALEASQRPSKLNSFKRYHLNIWVSSFLTWIGLDEFKSNNKGPIGLEYHKKNQTKCYCGLDLASTTDLTAFSMMFIETDDEGEPTSIDWQVYFWCPLAMIEGKERNNILNYPKWVKQKYIFATPGNVQNKKTIFDFIDEQARIYNIQSINVDAAFHAATLAEKVNETDIDWRGHSQTAPAMSTPTKEFRVWLGNGIVNYGGNPVLEWQSGNCETWEDANENVKLMKGTSKGKGAGRKKNKIDGFIAGVMSVSGYLQDKSNPKKGIPKGYKIKIF